MTLFRSCIALLLSSIIALPVSAFASEKEQSVKALGELNGVALGCSFPLESQHIKRVVVKKAPRTEAMGALFQSATNESFMTLSQGKKTCPSRQAFTGEMDTAIKRFQAAFASSPENPEIIEPIKGAR